MLSPADSCRERHQHLSRSSRGYKRFLSRGPEAPKLALPQFQGDCREKREIPRPGLAILLMNAVENTRKDGETEKKSSDLLTLGVIWLPGV